MKKVIAYKLSHTPGSRTVGILKKYRRISSAPSVRRVAKSDQAIQSPTRKNADWFREKAIHPSCITVRDSHGNVYFFEHEHLALDEYFGKLVKDSEREIPGQSHCQILRLDLYDLKFKCGTLQVVKKDGRYRGNGDEVIKREFRMASHPWTSEEAALLSVPLGSYKCPNERQVILSIYIPSGNLVDLMISLLSSKDDEGRILESIVAKQIVEGVKAINNSGRFIITDLKPENILIYRFIGEDGKVRLHTKIIDIEYVEAGTTVEWRQAEINAESQDQGVTLKWSNRYAAWTPGYFPLGDYASLFLREKGKLEVGEKEQVYQLGWTLIFLFIKKRFSIIYHELNGDLRRLIGDQYNDLNDPLKQPVVGQAQEEEVRHHNFLKWKYYYIAACVESEQPFEALTTLQQSLIKGCPIIMKAVIEQLRKEYGGRAGDNDLCGLLQEMVGPRDARPSLEAVSKKLDELLPSEGLNESRFRQLLQGLNLNPS